MSVQKTVAVISTNSIDYNGSLGIQEDSSLFPPPTYGTFPFLVAALTDRTGATTVIGGLAGGYPGGGPPVRIEFFASPAPDPSGYGEGQTYLGGTTSVIYGTRGGAAFSFTTSNAVFGKVITATYTIPPGGIPASSNGFTSAFSKAILVTRGTVVNTINDSGPGSLRQAILDADADPMPESIRFAIGSDHQQLEPSSPLPVVTNAVTIDATSQPGDTGGL